MAMILGTGLWIMHYMKHRPGILVTVSNFFIQIILPLILVTFWIDSLDSIKDRPELPYGFMEYKAFWNGIFLPDLWRISSFLQTHFDRIHVLNIENVSYIGMAADVFIILILIHFIYKIADKNANTIVLVADEFLNNLLITAFFILLFSFGLPFIIHTNWLKYTGRFQQFRSVGRFAWIFFYIINIYLFAWSYTNWTRRKTTFSHIILMLPVLLLLTDNLLMHRKMYVGNEKADKAMISETRIPFKPDQYQAILPFPFFFYGGEGFGIDDNCENIVNTEQLSLATGLPMIASNMDRTSAAQVIKNIAYSKNDHLPINVYKEYLSKKPILIMRANNCNIGPRESQLILKSIFVARSDKYTYYALYPDSIGKFNESLQEKRSLPN